MLLAGVFAAVCTTVGIGNVASAEVLAYASYRNAAGQTIAVDIAGIVNANGMVWFNKTVIDGPLTVTWNYNVNPSAANAALYNGATIVKNVASSAITTKVTFQFDLCPTILANSKFGGTTNVKLQANANGGQITCGTGPSLTGVLVDGEPVFTYYWCPFTMTSSGAGTAQTSSTFGQPIPSAPGPASVSSIGHFADFTLTDGDTATFTAYSAVNGEASYMPSAVCPTDVNGDGVVNKWDLIELLMAFGDTGSCLAADLNGDGVVDGLDLGMLIGTWGLCGN